MIINGILPSQGLIKIKTEPNPSFSQYTELTQFNGKRLLKDRQNKDIE